MFMHQKKVRKLYYFLTMWAVVVITVTMVLRFITPPFEKKCLVEAKRIGTEIFNSEVLNALRDADYNDIIIITKDENSKITMVQSDVMLINNLRSTIIGNVQQRFAELERQSIKIPMGVLTGLNLFTGLRSGY